MIFDGTPPRTKLAVVSAVAGLIYLGLTLTKGVEFATWVSLGSLLAYALVRCDPRPTQN